MHCCPIDAKCPVFMFDTLPSAQVMADEIFAIRFHGGYAQMGEQSSAGRPNRYTRPHLQGRRYYRLRHWELSVCVCCKNIGFIVLTSSTREGSDYISTTTGEYGEL